jgi:hypothetical protein
MVAIGVAVAVAAPALAIDKSKVPPGATKPPEMTPDVQGFQLNPTVKPYQDVQLLKSYNLDPGSYTVKITYTFPAPPPAQRGVPRAQSPFPTPERVASHAKITVVGPYKGGGETYSAIRCVDIPAFKGTSLTIESQPFTIPASNSPLSVTVSTQKPTTTKDCVAK